MTTPIHHVVSLGCNCHTAMFFKNNGWRKYSTPFDWICIGFKELIQILESRFSRFVDPAFLTAHEDGGPHQCGHLLYGDRMFHHFNPREAEHHAYYQRCITRFCTRPVNGEECVLYVYQAFYDKPTIPQLMQLRDLLSGYRGNAVFKLLVFWHEVNASTTGAPQFDVLENSQNLMIVGTKLCGNIDGVQFLDGRDHAGMTQLLNHFFVFCGPSGVINTEA